MDSPRELPPEVVKFAQELGIMEKLQAARDSASLLARALRPPFKDIVADQSGRHLVTVDPSSWDDTLKLARSRFDRDSTADATIEALTAEWSGWGRALNAARREGRRLGAEFEPVASYRELLLELAALPSLDQVSLTRQVFTFGLADKSKAAARAAVRLQVRYGPRVDLLVSWLFEQIENVDGALAKSRDALTALQPTLAPRRALPGRVTSRPLLEGQDVPNDDYEKQKAMFFEYGSLFAQWERTLAIARVIQKLDERFSPPDHGRYVSWEPKSLLEDSTDAEWLSSPMRTDLGATFGYDKLLGVLGLRLSRRNGEWDAHKKAIYEGYSAMRYETVEPLEEDVRNLLLRISKKGSKHPVQRDHGTKHDPAFAQEMIDIFGPEIRDLVALDLLARSRDLKALVEGQRVQIFRLILGQTLLPDPRKVARVSVVSEPEPPVPTSDERASVARSAEKRTVVAPEPAAEERRPTGEVGPTAPGGQGAAPRRSQRPRPRQGGPAQRERRGPGAQERGGRGPLG